jgi:hypothetical protein
VNPQGYSQTAGQGLHIEPLFMLVPASMQADTGDTPPVNKKSIVRMGSDAPDARLLDVHEAGPPAPGVTTCGVLKWRVARCRFEGESTILAQIKD